MYDTEYSDISLDENFNAETYSLTIEQYKEDDKIKLRYKRDFYCSWNGIYENVSFYSSEYWLLNEEYFFDTVRIRMCFIPLWQDFAKFAREGESKLFQIFNTMVRSHYKTSLAKSMFFYISG